MQYTILLDSRANIREVEAEEQTKFVVSIIEALEIPFEWDSNTPFSIFDKVKLRKVLSQYNISVLDDMSGCIKILLEREQIAVWHKPSFMLKEDLSQIDSKKRLYIEMKCHFDSIYDEAEPSQ